METIDTVEGHLLAAEQSLKQGHAREALAEAQAALRMQPQYGRAFAMIGLAYTKMGQDTDAREALTHAAEVAPLDATVRYHCYLALANLRDVEGARAQLAYYTQLDQGHAQAKAVLARLGGPPPDLPPLPRPATTAVWYDSDSSLTTAADDESAYGEQPEPPPGPDVVECSNCEKRTWKGWVCKHCGVSLPRR